MSPLHHPVRLWVVGGGLHVLDPQQLGEALPQGKGKLAALIWSEDGWYTKPVYPDDMSASTQSSVAMDFKGVASNNLDDLSTTL